MGVEDSESSSGKSPQDQDDLFSPSINDIITNRLRRYQEVTDILSHSQVKDLHLKLTKECFDKLNPVRGQEVFSPIESEGEEDSSICTSHDHFTSEEIKQFDFDSTIFKSLNIMSKCKLVIEKLGSSPDADQIANDMRSTIANLDTVILNMSKTKVMLRSKKMEPEIQEELLEFVRTKIPEVREVVLRIDKIVDSVLKKVDEKH